MYVRVWTKSSYSAVANCVEVSETEDGAVALRDSNDRDTVVTVSREDFAAFLKGAQAGEFDRFASAG